MSRDLQDEAPLFAVLRASLGLPPDDRWWHGVDADDRPTEELHERTLDGLRAW
jgi:hypothetical protein